MINIWKVYWLSDILQIFPQNCIDAQLYWWEFSIAVVGVTTVSYTHLDVYKRQVVLSHMKIVKVSKIKNKPEL